MKLNVWNSSAKLLVACAIAVFASSASADVTDDFDTGATGTGILSGSNGRWSAKWIAGTQQNLYDNQAANGVGGSNGVALDVLTAERSCNAINQTGVSVAALAGNTMTLSADFQFGHNGANLANQNQSFLGLQLSDTANWWDGNNIDFNIARRGPAGSPGTVLGVVHPTTFISGWIDNTQFGLPGGGAAGTSDWFSMDIVLTDNGTTYDAVYTLYNSSGSSVYSSGSIATTYASGTTLYGGFTTGWNNPGGTINSVNGATTANIDNFSFTSFNQIPEPASLMVVTGLFGLAAVRRRR